MPSTLTARYSTHLRSIAAVISMGTIAASFRHAPLLGVPGGAPAACRPGRAARRGGASRPPSQGLGVAGRPVPAALCAQQLWLPPTGTRT